MGSVANAVSLHMRAILSTQIMSLAWLLFECTTAFTSAWHARSVSLLAFGSDSFVEFVSAAIVLLQFTPKFRLSQRRAAKLCGALLYVLAGLVCTIAAVGLICHVESATSFSGAVITTLALLVMPILARIKHQKAIQINNAALRADAVQSATCAYLAGLTLVGILLHGYFKLFWIDQLAAFLAVPILIVEGRRARRGIRCACC